MEPKGLAWFNFELAKLNRSPRIMAIPANRYMEIMGDLHKEGLIYGDSPSYYNLLGVEIFPEGLGVKL